MRDELDAALREADRLEAMIADLLTHARSSATKDTISVALTTTARQHAAGWKALYAQAGRTITVRGEQDVRAMASRGTVGQVLDVLLDNAMRHGAGPVTVTIGTDGRLATMTAQDQGPGIPDGNAEQIFARGATGADSTGIGLHLARTLARADHGSLRLITAAPPCFELRLRMSTA